MRKLLIAVLATLLLIVGVSPAAAVPPDELTDLAEHYPDDVAVFGAIRTDDAYIDTLNGLAARIGQRVQMIPADFDLREELFSGMDFEQAIRPWLGDSAAVGVRFTDVEEVFIAVDVVDREAAQVFMSNLGLQTSDLRDGTLYTGTNPQFGINYLLLDDVLLAGQGEAGLAWLQQGVRAPLNADAGFADVLTRLPESSYNAVLMGNAPALAPVLLEDTPTDGLMALGFDPQAAISGFGWQAAGFTILDERALTMDVATTITDLEAVQAAGISLDGNDPLNLDFASNIPADAPLVLLGTDFGGGLLGTLNQIEELGNRFEALNEQGMLSRNEESLTLLDDSATFARQAFRGLAGATLEEAFGWMTGTFGMYMTPGLNENGLPTLDTAYLTEATDPAAADMFVNTWLPNLLNEVGLDYVQEEAAVNLPLLGNILADSAYEIVAATGNDLFAIGTRSGVEFATGGDTGLPSDATYQAAQAYFLPDTESLAYIHPAPLQELAGVLAETEPDFQAVAVLLPIIESGSITASYSDEGNGNARLVLTLAE
jgi:hypothetical protein